MKIVVEYNSLMTDLVLLSIAEINHNQLQSGGMDSVTLLDREGVTSLYTYPIVTGRGCTK